MPRANVDNRLSLKTKISIAISVGLFLLISSAAIVRWVMTPGPESLRLDLALPYASQFIDAGLIPVVQDRGHSVGDTYTLPSKALLYSSTQCFSGDMIERRGVTSAPKDFSIANLHQGNGILKALGMAELEQQSIDVTQISITFGGESHQVQYELASLGKMEAGLKDENACPELRKLIDSFKQGDNVDGDASSNVVVVAEVLRGAQQLTIVGRFKRESNISDAIKASGVYNDAKVTTSSATDGTINISITKSADEVFAVRPAFVLINDGATLGPTQGQQHWSWIKFQEDRPSNIRALRRMLEATKM